MDEQREGAASLPGEAAEVEKILKRCMDAPGYVLFSGIIRAENGNLFLDSDYRRYHTSLEDIKKVFEFIGEQIRNEGLDPIEILIKAKK